MALVLILQLLTLWPLGHTDITSNGTQEAQEPRLPIYSVPSVTYPKHPKPLKSPKPLSSWTQLLRQFQPSPSIYSVPPTSHPKFRPLKPLPPEPRSFQPLPAGPRPFQPLPAGPRPFQPLPPEPRPFQPLPAGPRPFQPPPPEPRPFQPLPPGLRPFQPPPPEPRPFQPLPPGLRPFQPPPPELRPFQPPPPEPRPFQPLPPEPRPFQPPPPEPRPFQPPPPEPRPSIYSVPPASYPKPSLGAQPAAVVTPGMNVTLTCRAPQPSWRFALFKSGELAPLLYQDVFAELAEFFLQEVTEAQGGSYQCRYRSPRWSLGAWSQPSDALELLVTDQLPRPSLVALPGPVVAPGDTVRLRCAGRVRNMSFALYREGEARPLQFRASPQAWADFPLPGARAPGTYACYYHTPSAPYVLSPRSQTLVIRAAGSDRLDYTKGNLVRLALAGLVLASLAALVGLEWRSWRRAPASA